MMSRTSRSQRSSGACCVKNSSTSRSGRSGNFFSFSFSSSFCCSVAACGELSGSAGLACFTGAVVAAGSLGWLAWAGTTVTAPFKVGGAAPWRGASGGSAGWALPSVNAAGCVVAILGPGAGGRAAAFSAVVGLATVGISATAVRAGAKFSALADAAGGAVFAGAAAITEAVGAGGAETGATGAAASFSGATLRAARITGSERTMAPAGTTVTKRWFISLVRSPARHERIMSLGALPALVQNFVLNVCAAVQAQVVVAIGGI